MPSAPERGPGRERLRRRRHALLLELGALVYELHRRGRRAPELLQRKAAELDGLEDKGEEAAGGGGACMSCGEAAAPGQLVCLSCGARLALGRRPGALPLMAALLAVIVIGAGAAGFALSELTSAPDDPEPELAAVTERPAMEAEAEPAPKAEPAPTAEPAPQADTAAGAAQQPRHSLLLEWPGGLTAHTVVLVTTSDRPAARRVARGAARSGIEAGMLRAADYDLGAGLWIVFAGRFDTRRGALRQAADLAPRYPGAYPQLIEPAG